MNFDLDIALRVAGIVATVLSVGVSVWLYIHAANRREVQTLRTDLRNGDAELQGAIRLIRQDVVTGTARDTDLDKRLAILETKMLHVPTHADLQGIRQEMRDLNEAVAAISERSETTQEMVQRIQQYLIEGGSRR